MSKPSPRVSMHLPRLMPAAGFSFLSLAVTVPGCTNADPSVEYDSTGHEFSRAERRAIEESASRATKEIRTLLPSLPRRVRIVVNAGHDVIPETGETAASVPPDLIRWTVDPSRNENVETIARSQLRATLFHEMNHLARGVSVQTSSLMDDVVSEGLATVFERDQAGVSVPWGSYPENVSEWVKELMSQPSTASRGEWLYAHPDGRRWVGLRAGTYLVDRAMKRSGKTAAELTQMPTEHLLKLALSP